MDVSIHGWGTPISTLLVFCDKDEIISAASLGTTCISNVPSQWAIPLHNFNFANSSHLLLDTSNIPLWQWTADMWIIKNSDATKSVVFFNPVIMYTDYLTNGNIVYNGM